ncbi:calcineurin-like metallo-phosphoesterase superfamily protein isoform X2 [Tasmannia lanceolata]
MTKAAILGNHDCWNTHQFSAKKKDRVQLQLECLGDQHVGYCRLDFPSLKLSVVGGRPFSCGGDSLFRQKLLSARYGVCDMEGSAKKIYEAALGTPEGYSIIFLAHNGPTGLGSERNDICGRDWVFGGGDHGDPDLAQAISELQMSTQFSIPLVVFGHMHKELAYRSGLRKMIVVGVDNTVYLNGAIVPRVTHLVNKQGTGSHDPIGTSRAFTVIEILDGRLAKITESWVSIIGDETTLKEEHLLYRNANEIAS